MSIEGLWAAEFGHAGAEWVGANGGVVVLETNRIFGGDSGFAYQGHFTLINGWFSGKLDVYRHREDAGFTDVFMTGADKFQLTIEGRLQPDGTILGRLVYPEAAPIGVQLRKLADLP